MPHSRNRMQLRGDIHPPEVEDMDMSMAFDDEGEPRQFDDVDLRLPDVQQPTVVVLAIPEEQGIGQKAQSVARRQVASRPLVAMLGAFVLGVVAIKLMRRGAQAL